MAKRTSRIGRDIGTPFIKRVGKRRHGTGEDQNHSHITALTALFTLMNKSQRYKRNAEIDQNRGALIKAEADCLESESNVRETKARIM